MHLSVLGEWRPDQWNTKYLISGRILRKFWHFFIAEPQCSIVGEKSVYLNVGSSHTINCTVASPQPPDHIFWYFNHRPLPVTSHGHPGHSGEAGDWTVTSLMAPDISWSQVNLGHRPSRVSTDHAMAGGAGQCPGGALRAVRVSAQQLRLGDHQPRHPGR